MKNFQYKNKTFLPSLLRKAVLYDLNLVGMQIINLQDMKFGVKGAASRKVNKLLSKR